LTKNERKIEERQRGKNKEKGEEQREGA